VGGDREAGQDGGEDADVLDDLLSLKGEAFSLQNVTVA